MQSKFVGDAIDFAKYGLLRRLCGLTDPDTPEPDLSLGIIWYLTPDNCCRRDGGSVGFLRATPGNHRRYRACDPVLWGVLKGLVDGNRRCIHKIRGTGILPPNTLYYDAPLFYVSYVPRPRRDEIRALWFAGALEKTRDADIVYLDPDTGIAPSENEMFRKDGPKYTYLSDIREFWCRGQSVVIYQHLNRQGADRLIRDKTHLLRDEFGVEPIVVRAASCLFFILSQPRHWPRIEERVRLMRAEDDGWGQHTRPEVNNA